MITSMIEKRASAENPNTTLKEAAKWLFDALGGQESASGVRVNEENAIEWTSLSVGIRRISGIIASLPFKVYERLEPRGKRPVRNHPVYPVIHDQANPEMTAFEFWEMMVAMIPAFGVAYAEKVRDGAGEIRELWPIHPDRVKPKRDRDGNLFYQVTLPPEFQDQEGTRKVVQMSPEELMRIPGFSTGGLVGRSLYRMHKDAIGLGLATERFAAKYFANGANPVGALEHPGKLSTEAAKRLRDNVKAVHGGLNNMHRVAILEEGMEWKQITTDPEKSQLLEARKFQVTEAARILGIPPHLVGALDRATHNNIEHQNIEFKIFDLNPWLRRISNRVDISLFSEDERDEVFAEHVTDELMRADAQARGELYQNRFQTASITPNEIRDNENDNPVEGGDQPFAPVNMIPLSQALSMSVEDRATLLAAQAGGKAEPELRELSEAGETETRQDDEDLGAVDARLRLIEDFRPVFVDAASRMVRGEVRNLERIVDETLASDSVQSFIDEIDRYYSVDHPDFARKVMGPVFRSLGQAVARTAGEAVDEVPLEEATSRFVDEYNDHFGDRYSARSRRELTAIAEEARDDDEADSEEVVRTRLARWEEGDEEAAAREEQVADDETNKLDNAVAKFAFVAAGFMTMRWDAIGSNCPICDRLDGTVVKHTDSFLQEGEEMQLDDEKTFTPGFSVGHPPAHGGCDCRVVPDA